VFAFVDQAISEVNTINHRFPILMLMLAYVDVVSSVVLLLFMFVDCFVVSAVSVVYVLFFISPLLVSLSCFLLLHLL